MLCFVNVPYDVTDAAGLVLEKILASDLQKGACRLSVKGLHLRVEHFPHGRIEIFGSMRIGGEIMNRCPDPEPARTPLPRRVSARAALPNARLIP